jgi:hypothetical protein
MPARLARLALAAAVLATAAAASLLARVAVRAEGAPAPAGEEAAPAPAGEEASPAPAGEEAAPAPSPVAWRSLPGLPGLRDAGAVALDPASGRIAVGDAEGVWILAPESAPRRALRRGPVRDLRFEPDGVLLAATERGLYAIAHDGRARKLALQGGSKASRARRLARAGAALAVGTEAGVQIAPDGGPFAKLDAGLPDAPVDALALRAQDAGLELWVASEGALRRALLLPGAQGFSVAAVEEPAIADGPGAREAVDVLADAGGVELAVLSPTHLALLRKGAWRSLPLELPAGRRALRLGTGAGRLWIASDGGVAEAGALEGPWRRAAPPAGGTAALALAGAPERILAVGARGLLAGARAVAAEARGGAPAARALATPLAHEDYAFRLRSEPSVERVHAAALRWLALGPERMRDLARGADRRGWLPVVGIRGEAGRGRSIRIDRDQVVSSGLLHELLDRQVDRGSDYGGGLTLAWDLGDLAYHPEAIDVSKEAREVIELRDEVLDEVTQLYFERRRVLLSLRAGPGDEVELARLRLRADELAAGLDAWTGGWFSRHAAPLSAAAPSASPLRP